MANANMNNDPLEDGLSVVDYMISFIFAIVSVAVAICIQILTECPPHLPLALCLISLAIIIALSWPFALCQGKWPLPRPLDWYANFGRRMWHFPSLWFVVCLIGIYLATISYLGQYGLLIKSQQLKAQPPIADHTGLLLSYMQNIIIAIFLAVITSVLAHTFTSIGQQGKDLKASGNSLTNAIEASENINTIINSTAKDVKEMSKELENLSETLLISARSSRSSEQIYAIAKSARKLSQQENEMVPLCDSLLRMCKGVTDFHDVALQPLLAPGVDPPQGGRHDIDTIVQVAERLHTNAEERPHYAYMSAAIGRYFAAETIERQLPGVLLHVTSFAYYISTIGEIVKALEPWYDKYEFYTLMPKPPLEVFKFNNSTDIDEWRRFLQTYCDFQLNNKGVWRRYFAYTKADKHPKGFIKLEEIKKEMETGYVLTDTDPPWLPRKIYEGELDRYFPAGYEHIRDRVKSETKFHDGVTTLSITCERNLPEEFGWRTLEDILLEYHGLSEGADKQSIEDRFIYRSIDDINVFHPKEHIIIPIETRPFKLEDETPTTRKRSFKIPRDFFAIREKEKEDHKSWVFMIGLDEASVGGGSGIHLAFAPILDLATMADSHPESINYKTAEMVRNMLENIFNIKNIPSNNWVSPSRIRSEV